MKSKAVSGIMLTLLLIYMLTSSFNVQMVSALGTIYIRADGSVEPPTAPIHTVDNITYTFTGNINDSVVVERSDVVLDGNGFTLQGSDSGQGVRLNSVIGSTIKGIVVKGFSYGIYLVSSSNNAVTGNSITDCTYGVGFHASSHNIISYNNITENIYHGYPSPGGGGIGLWQGSNNNKITRNTIKDNYAYGIAVWGATPSRYNEVYENDVTDCRYIGIRLDSGPNCVFRNNMTNNGNSIACYRAAYNSVYENSIKNSTHHAIILTEGGGYNKVFRNYVTNNTYAITVYSYLTPSYNRIFGNEIRNNEYGLWSTGRNNSYYHNNFVENGEQVYFAGGINNVHDNGYPSGGNYWSDYNGADLFSGPYQNETGSDGIGDTPYFLDEDEKDNYPLMYPWDRTENWTFAIITDFHIGRGYPDYGGQGWNDAGSHGQDYYLTDRLKETVDWILRNRIGYDIRFVAVLGDIAENAEYSEFDKAKSILSRLDDPDGDPSTNDAVPYVPIIGNHDVWPYTENLEADWPESDSYFRQIFINERLTLLLSYFDNWQSPDITEEITWFPNKKWTAHLQNYAFSYEDVKFVCLDFVTRIPTPWGKGVGSDAVSHPKTKEWLRSSLANGETTILFSHHAFDRNRAWGFSDNEMDGIGAIIQDSGAFVEAHFAGHIHGFGDSSYQLYLDANNVFWGLSDVPSVTTEAMMVSGNEIKETGVKGTVRMVTVTDSNIEEPSRTECESPVLNPYLYRLSPKLIGVDNPIRFEIWPFQRGRTFNYVLDWGDDTNDTGQSSGWEEYAVHFYANAGTFMANLTVTDADDPSLVETITHPVEVDIGSFPAYLIASAGHVIPRLLNGVNVAENPQNNKEQVTLMVSHSEATCVASLVVHFESATGNIDLSQATVDVNLTERKSIIYMPVWPQELEESRVLFIPSTGVGAIYVCLNATSLDEVNCENADFVANVGETVNDLTVAIAYYNGQEYYLVYGDLANLAGGELSRDVAITGITLPKAIVGQGFDLPVNVTIQNQGYLTENFNLTIWANTTLIGTAANVSLTSGSYTTIVLNWNTSGIPFGNYTIIANVSTVPGETDAADNTYEDGILLVTMPGDVDGDLDVDYDDFIVLAGSYGSSSGHPAYRREADFDDDGDVDYDDFIVLAGNYGKTV